MTVDSAGSQTQVQYTPNAALVVPQWTPGTMLGSAYYTVARAPLTTAGKVAIYSPATATGSVTKTVTFDPGGWPYTILSITGANGVYNATGGNPNGNCAATDPTGANASNLIQTQALPSPVTISNCKVDYWVDTGILAAVVAVSFYDNTGTLISTITNIAHPALAATWYTYDFGVLAINNVSYMIAEVGESSFVPGGTNTVRMDNFAFTYTAFASGQSAVRVSSDFGATFGSALNVGNSPGAAGGFDMQRAGGISLAAGAGTVFKASTFGGAYSAYASFGSANPTTIIIPWYTRNSTTALQTTAGSVDALIGLDSGTLGLCWLLANGGTIDITPAPGFNTAGPHDVTCAYGKFISAAGGGTLWQSNNAGSTWIAVGSFSPGHFIRVRRNDASWLVNRGQLYAIDSGGTIEFTSHGVTHGALYPRVMGTPANSFDVYP